MIADLLAESVPRVAPGTESAVLIGVIVAMSSALTEAVKALVAWRRNGKDRTSEGRSGDSRECLTCQAETHRVLEIVSATNANGVPLVYGAHQLADEIRGTTREIRRLADGVERIVNRRGGLPPPSMN